VTSFLSGADRTTVRKLIVLSALLAASAALAGCESSSALLGNTAGAQPETQVAQPAPVAAPSRVSVAPVIGAPDGVSKQLHQDFSSAIGQKKVTVVSAQEKSDYALRGYIVAAKDKGATKVSYIWDVTDPAGKRVNRITGEEVIAGSSASDPWATVTPQITQAIAQKSAESLASWLGQNARASVPVANLAPGAQPTGIGATAPTSVGSLPQNAATPQPVRVAAPAPATAGPPAAAVPSLTGAPGDGNSALAAALQAELARNGVNSAGQTSSAYRVEGVVKIGAAADGKQPVQIDWNVKDPQGKRLGTVTQKNEIAAGSLDGTWGKTADAAAAAAAQGILKLIPKTTASAN